MTARTKLHFYNAALAVSLVAMFYGLLWVAQKLEGM